MVSVNEHYDDASCPQYVLCTIYLSKVMDNWLVFGYSADHRTCSGRMSADNDNKSIPKHRHTVEQLLPVKSRGQEAELREKKIINSATQSIMTTRAELLTRERCYSVKALVCVYAVGLYDIIAIIVSTP